MKRIGRTILYALALWGVCNLPVWNWLGDASRDYADNYAASEPRKPKALCQLGRYPDGAPQMVCERADGTTERWRWTGDDETGKWIKEKR